jgi:hypothetical protein
MNNSDTILTLCDAAYNACSRDDDVSFSAIIAEVGNTIQHPKGYMIRADGYLVPAILDRSFACIYHILNSYPCSHHILIRAMTAAGIRGEADLCYHIYLKIKKLGKNYDFENIDVTYLEELCGYMLVSPGVALSSLTMTLEKVERRVSGI